MSPTTTAPDKTVNTEVIKRVLQRRFPRTYGTLAIEGDRVTLLQPPEPTLTFSITLQGRTAWLQRLAEDGSPWPGALPEELVVPEEASTPVPDLQTHPLVLRELAEQVRRVLSTARTQLQPVRSDVAEEAHRLRLGVSGFDPLTARGSLTITVSAALDAAGQFALTVSEAETLLTHERRAAGDRATALAALRQTGDITQLGTVHQQEQADHALRLALIDLSEAVSEAALFKGAFTRAALVLAQAGIQAAAEMQVEAVTVQLTRLKVALAEVRQHALALDPTLVALTQQHGQSVPRLMWNQPKDLFAGPSIA
jgi:hypothetical protein